MTRVYYFIFLIGGLVLASSNTDKKKIQKLKNVKPNYKTVCSDYDNQFNPHVEKRLFIPSANRAMSLSTISDTYDIFKKQCANDSIFKSFNQSLIEIIWKYQFFESPHCIRVDLDFVNVTNFKSNLNYNYYMFSYREFGKKNKFLKRNLIEENTNSLIIHRAHLRPYVVCVTFYKNIPNLDENSTCSNINEFLMDDDRVHDVGLCVDIDTQAHFLSAINSDTHGFEGVDRELIMVIFILVLLGILLVVITIAHYIIEKPHKQKYFGSFHKLFHRKSHTTSNSHSVTQSNIGSHNSLNKDKIKDHNPIIMVTDCTNAITSNTTLLEKDEPKETDSLLTKDFQTPFVPVMSDNHKVMFHIGEPILEESPSSSQVKMSEAEKETKKKNRRRRKSRMH